MKVLFTTQSNSLPMFYALGRRLDEQAGVERLGFTIANSLAYADFVAQHPEFEREGHLVLKEWEVTSRRGGKPDLGLLARYENELGEPGLFGAIVGDRRLLMGPDCTYSQDYRRRFSDDQLLCILEAGVRAMDRMFAEVEPDVVVGFICVTLLDYLAYLFARARSARYFNLRPTRIGNHVLLASTINDPSPELYATYQQVPTRGSPRLDDARALIAKVRGVDAKYEGVVAPSAAPAQSVRPRDGLGALGRFWRHWRTYRTGEARDDNHVPDPVRQALFLGVRNPWRARRTERMLRPHYVRAAALEGRRYVFFPLHTEPEVSLLVYARPLVNQIEVIRALAFSLPADMVLVVKEHPWMVGKRSLGAYRKMLDIPRVRLARPEARARDFVAGAELVTVLTSSVGLEAAILKRPVLSLGQAPFNLLPDTMVQRCRELSSLSADMKSLLARHRHDEAALESYVAATLEISVSVNLYSVLLGRSTAYAEETSEFEQDIAKLADHFLSALAVPEQRLAEAASW